MLVKNQQASRLFTRVNPKLVAPVLKVLGILASFQLLVTAMWRKEKNQTLKNHLPSFLLK